MIKLDLTAEAETLDDILADMEYVISELVIVEDSTGDGDAFVPLSRYVEGAAGRLIRWKVEDVEPLGLGTGTEPEEAEVTIEYPRETLPL